MSLRKVLPAFFVGFSFLAGTALAQENTDTEPGLVLSPVSYAALPGWVDDTVSEILPALRLSCGKIVAKPQIELLFENGIGGRAGDWAETCRAAASLNGNDDDTVRGYFEQYFQPFLVADLSRDWPARGLFTGYYEIGLRGDIIRSGVNQTPLYAPPDDLVMAELGTFRDTFKGERIGGRLQNNRLVPYDDRRAIEAGSLQGKNLEVAWVADPIDAFFLHIQGSGRILKPDGSSMRIGYAGQNGHAYTSIGKILIERGEIEREKMSMPAIRAWLLANPEDGIELMRENRSFIFFRKLEDDGPIGAQNVALTPGRSLAIDRRFFPLGLPFWMFSSNPLDEDLPIGRLLMAQDTGGAIRGAVRGDVFWGFGQEAEKMAGAMKEPGSYFVLLPIDTVAQCKVCEKE